MEQSHLQQGSGQLASFCHAAEKWSQGPGTQQSFLAWAAFARVIAPWRGLGEISLETKPIIASF